MTDQLFQRHGRHSKDVDRILISIFPPTQFIQYTDSNEIRHQAMNVVVVSPYSYAMFIYKLPFKLENFIIFQPISFIGVIVKCGFMSDDKICPQVDGIADSRD